MVAEDTPLDSAHWVLDAILALLRLAKSEVVDSVAAELVTTKAGVLEKALVEAAIERRAKVGMESFIVRVVFDIRE